MRYTLLFVLLITPLFTLPNDDSAMDFYVVRCPNDIVINIKMNDVQTVEQLKSKIAQEIEEDSSTVQLFGTGQEEETVELIEGSLEEIIFYEAITHDKKNAFVKGRMRTDGQGVIIFSVELDVEHELGAIIKPASRKLNRNVF